MMIHLWFHKNNNPSIHFPPNKNLQLKSNDSVLYGKKIFEWKQKQPAKTHNKVNKRMAFFKGIKSHPSVLD